MIKAHVLDADGYVINTVRVKELEPGMIEANHGAIGWHYSDGVWTPPEEVVTVPAAITARQLRLALLGAGLLTAAEQAAAAAGGAIEIDWEYATMFERNNINLRTMAYSLGLTDEQIDDLFIAGAAL